MSLGSDFIKRMQSRFQRDLTDPEQRRLVQDRTVRLFARKLEQAPQKGESLRQEAYTLLEELIQEFTALEMDVLEVYQQAFEACPDEIQVLRTIVGLLRSRDARDREAMGYYRKLSEQEPRNFQLLQILVECYRLNQDPYSLMIIYEQILEHFHALEEDIRWGKTPQPPNWEDIVVLHKVSAAALAEMYAEMNRTDEKALNLYLQNLGEDEPNLTILKILAETWIKENKMDQDALGVYELYLAYEPMKRDLRLLLSRCYISGPRREEGLTILKRLFDENPQDTATLALLMNNCCRKTT